MAELLETLGEAITIRDPNDTLVYANRAALSHLGFDTLEELKARSLDSIMADYIVTDEHGEPLAMSDVPSVRLLRGQTAEPLLMRTVDRRSGEVRWDLLKTAGLTDRDGELSAAVTVIEDLTAVKTAEVHMRILSEAGRVLTSTLELDQTLQSVADSAVPEFADWCAVDLIDEELARDHVAIAHADAGRRELVSQVGEFRAPELSPDSTLGRVFLTGKSRVDRVGRRRAAAATRSGRDGSGDPAGARDPLGDRRTAPRPGAHRRRDVPSVRPSPTGG